MRQNHDIERLFERATSQVRAAEPSAEQAEQAAARVWAKLNSSSAETAAGAAEIREIHGCDDYQALIPAYLAGSLPQARRLLFEDHSRECVPCRRALKEAREGHGAPARQKGSRGRAREHAQGRSAPARRTSAMRFTRFAAAAVLVAGLAAALYLVGGMLTGGGPSATVANLDGELFRVAGTGQVPLSVGEEIREGEIVRTSRGGGAVVELQDGSRVELRERTELAVDEGRGGTTLELERGSVIVEAAPQRQRHLYVSTEECLVSVTGTIFAVNHGTKGSRVSVVEGEVRVSHSGEETVLLPGEQIATRTSLGQAPIAEELAWSRNVDHYIELLEEFADLRRQIAERVPPADLRYSSRLLDLMPEDTALYVAVPNLSEKVAETHRVIQEKLQESPVLQEYWAQRQGAHQFEPLLDEIITRLGEFGDYLGREMVAGARRGADGEPLTSPVALAEIVDADGLRDLAGRYVQVEGGDGNPFDEVAFIDDPFAPAPEAELYIWLTDDLLAAAGDLAELQRVATLLDGGSNPFSETSFYAAISELYAEGTELLVAADVESLVRGSLEGTEDPTAEATLDRLGVMNTRHLLLEQKTIDKTYHRAALTFHDTRRGVTSWLAEPAPMGSLDFISPEAKWVSAMVIKDPVALFDDLEEILGSDDFGRVIHEFEERYGLSLRDDFAAVLGGEVAFALDGPLVPTPSWKLIFEVYDPARFQWILEQGLTELNLHRAERGEESLEITARTSSGRTFYSLPVMGEIEVHYTFDDGYLLMAPSRALLDRAIRFRDSGYTITGAERFRALLPVDGQVNFSALAYQDMGTLLQELAERISEGDLTDEQRQALEDLGQQADQTLGYAYAEDDRILFAAASNANMVSTLIERLLGLENPAGLGALFEGFSGFGG